MTSAIRANNTVGTSTANAPPNDASSGGRGSEPPPVGTPNVADLATHDAGTGPFTITKPFFVEALVRLRSCQAPKGLDRPAGDRQLSIVMRPQEPGGEWF